MPAANDRLYGRDDDIEEIVRILTTEPASLAAKRVRFALLGAGGQGKTAMALKIMAHPAIRRCYSVKNGVWVPCEEAGSAALLLDVLYTSFNIPKDTNNTIEDILKELRRTSDPIILLLDNFETPWNATGDRGAVARILCDISQFSHVALFITMRATVAPCDEITWVERRIQALDPEASYQLYTAVDEKANGDPRLSELLERLGHLALAVKLMARHGKNTGSTIEQLISSYSLTGTAMLGPTEGSDPQNSVPISICMSLESSLVKGELNASRLLHIIAMLPSGTTLDALLSRWAPDLENLPGALRALLEASLLESRTTTYFVLPVIRSYLLDPSRLSTEVRDSMVDVACHFLEQHASINPGDESFKEDMKSRAVEEINLQSILLDATESSPAIVRALHSLASHQYRTRARRTEVIEHAVKLCSGISDHHLVGQVLDLYAAILMAVNRLKDSLEQRKLAREAFLAASEPSFASWMLLRVAEVSVLIDTSTNEIPLIEQALRELQSIANPSPTVRQPRLLRPFSRLLKHFKKDGSTNKPEAGEVDDMDMVRCMRHLGRAHARHGNLSEAISFLTQARDLCLELPLQGAKCAKDLAIAYRRLGLLDQAESWAVLSLDELNQLGVSAGDSRRLLGMIYISKRDYHQAIECLQEDLIRARASGKGPRTIASILVELGRAYMAKGDIDDARKFFLEASALRGDSWEKTVRKFYLEKLDNPLRFPTPAERDALSATDHDEDIAI
ncbi:hypothetical protein C8J56DRAFT_526809 [Mycena floridula]|nr:hypothetical protein C8J56DRAFT_526809 [Mycena floridula]